MCAVYCLVPCQEQLDPLVDRLQDAGVATDDIAVILRWGSEKVSADLTAASRCVQSFWDWSNASAQWWMQALYGLPFPRQAAPAEAADGHAVISLERYRAATKK